MFCIECGNKLTEKDKFCPNCGKVNKDYKEETIVEKKSFCTECGRPLTENDKFCINCGKKNNDYVETEEVKTVEEEVTPVEEVPATEPVTETVEQAVEDVPAAEETPVVSIDNQVETVEPAPIETPVVKEDKPKKKKSKKIFFIIPAVLLIVAALIFVYFKFIKEDDNSGYKTSYISWDYESDIKEERVPQTKLKVAVKVTPSDHEDDVEYYTNCGYVRGFGQSVEWDLTKASGKCTLIAKFRNEIIVKHLFVYPNNDTELGFENKIDMDSDEDLDFDGLTNKEEKEYGTNPELADTDMDGLDDKYELTESKTDPTKKDSDGDGLSDFDEIELDLDPLKEDSKGDGVKDGERDLTYTINNENLSLTVKGKGDIASTVSEVNANTKISGKKGLINKLYSLYTDGKLEEASLTIKYTDAELAEYGLNEDNLAIYYYNEKESKYEKIDSVIDKENKTVKATLKHFSNYVLGDSSILKTSETSQVLFVLDNSWSMYSPEQYKKYTGEEYPNNRSELGYDVDGLRFALTGELVSRFNDKGYQIGLSEFRRDYANAYPIGSDIDDIEEKLTQMTGAFITKTAGTDITNALTKSLDEFKTDADNKYIIILTDGEDSSLKSKTKKIIEQANKKGIKICAVGFGEGSSNTGLSQISEETGCQFYSSGDAFGLDELFEKIGAEVNDGLIDVNGDNEVDGILLADSGFLVNRDGFSFANYGSNFSEDGHCFGMAVFAELYYKKMLPMSSDAKESQNLTTSYSYDLSNTYFSNYSPLYNYKLKSNALKYQFGYDIFNEDFPIDAWSLEGNVLSISEPYRSEIVDTGIYDIIEKTSNLDKKSQENIWGFTFKSKEKIILNENKIQTSNLINHDDKELFNAIYRSFVNQDETRNTDYYSGTTWLMWGVQNISGIDLNVINGNRFIWILKSRLEDKDAPVISSDYSNGYHSINAISLLEDIYNPNIYYIGVYDNNYPGEKRYVTLECKKDTCVTKANSYYSNSKQPLRMSPTVEETLSHFE